MCYQIQSTQTFQDIGKRCTKTKLLSIDSWTITLHTEIDAIAISNILSPSQPYILGQHEFNAPVLRAVKGGSHTNAKSLAEVIRLLGEGDYYNDDGSRKTDAEIYGDNY
jgi:hypothetical protein